MAHAEVCPVCKGTAVYPPYDTTVAPAGPQAKCHGCNGKGWVAVEDGGASPAIVPLPTPQPPTWVPWTPIPQPQPWWESPYQWKITCGPDITEPRVTTVTFSEKSPPEVKS